MEKNEPGRPSEKELRRQIGRVERSSMFRDAPALRDFLRFVVEETLADPTVKLPAPVVARGVFGRGSGFQNSTDPIVRVTAMRLRRALALYYAGEGARDGVLIDLPSGTYKPVFSYCADEDLASLKEQFLAKSAEYNATGSRPAHDLGKQLVASALVRWPDDPDFLSEQAILGDDEVVFGYTQRADHFDVSDALLERAMSQGAPSPKVLISATLHAVHLGRCKEVISLCDDLLLCAGGDPMLEGLGRGMKAFVTDPRDAGFDRLKSSEEEKTAIPWLNYAEYVADYEAGDYEAALNHAIALGLRNNCWGGILRAAALGQLGLTQAAGRELQRADHHGPHMLNGPRRFISAYFSVAHVADHVFEGLEKAGLNNIARG